MKKIVKKFLLLLLVTANLAVIIWIWRQNSWPLITHEGQAGLLIGLGRLFGLLAEFFILLELATIGRVTWIEQIFGHDRLNIWHRWSGYALIVWIIGHPLMLSIGYGQLAGRSPAAQFVDFLTSWEDVFKAFLALIVFVLLIAISVAIVRKRLRYETWYFAHLLMYLAIVLAFGHQINTGDVSFGRPLYYWLALNFIGVGLLLVFRFFRPLYFFIKYRFKIQKIVKETEDIFSIYLTGKNLSKFKFSAGQFCNLTFLQKGLWFTHPFSFSAAPNGKFLRFSIKIAGDFTSRVKELQTGTQVIVDGPLGIFTRSAAGQKKFLLIAGGIGISPILALAEELSQNRQDAIMLWGNKTRKDLCFLPELQRLPVKTYNFLSRDSAENCLPGRISLEQISKLIPDFKEREVYLCGPMEMMIELVKDLKLSGMDKGQIHFENFAY